MFPSLPALHCSATPHTHLHLFSLPLSPANSVTTWHTLDSCLPVLLSSLSASPYRTGIIPSLPIGLTLESISLEVEPLCATTDLVEVLRADVAAELLCLLSPSNPFWCLFMLPTLHGV